MGIFGKNIYNINYPSALQQISRNKIDIENLQKIIKQAYKTTEQLNEQSVSVALNTTNITDNTITSGWLISPNGLLFQIASVLEDLVYINYWATLRGETGAQGAQGPTGPTGAQGKRGFGFYTTQQQILSTGTTEIEYGDIIGYDNPQVGDLVISENEQSNGYYGRITSLATLTTTIEYLGTLKGEKGINYTGTWVSGGEYYIDDVATYNGSTYICISNINGGITNPDADPTHWALIAKSADVNIKEHYIYISTKYDNSVPDNNGNAIKLYIHAYRITKQDTHFSLDDLTNLFSNYNVFNGIFTINGKRYLLTSCSFIPSYVRISGKSLTDNDAMYDVDVDIPVENFTINYLFMTDYDQNV